MDESKLQRKLWITRDSRRRYDFTMRDTDENGAIRANLATHTWKDEGTITLADTNTTLHVVRTRAEKKWTLRASGADGGPDESDAGVRVAAVRPKWFRRTLVLQAGAARYALQSVGVWRARYELRPIPDGADAPAGRVDPSWSVVGVFRREKGYAGPYEALSEESVPFEVHVFGAWLALLFVRRDKDAAHATAGSGAAVH